MHNFIDKWHTDNYDNTKIQNLLPRCHNEERRDDFTEHTLWHNRYEEDWLRAFPLGNGRVAAMVYGGPDREILQINEESLWSGRQLQEKCSSTPEILAEIRRLLFAKRIEAAFALCEKHLLSDPPMVRHYQTFG